MLPNTAACAEATCKYPRISFDTCSTELDSWSSLATLSSVLASTEEGTQTAAHETATRKATSLQTTDVVDQQHLWKACRSAPSRHFMVLTLEASEDSSVAGCPAATAHAWEATDDASDRVSFSERAAWLGIMRIAKLFMGATAGSEDDARGVIADWQVWDGGGLLLARPCCEVAT